MNRPPHSGPPPYRPPAPKPRPPAPPVYRPQPPVQAKLAPPPVYRPQPPVQAKLAPPPVYRPQPPVQAKLAPPPVYRPRPPVYRPAAPPAAVLQRLPARRRIIQCVRSTAVKEARAQTLTDPGKSTSKTYDWQSSFVIHVYGDQPTETPSVRVVVYLEAAVDDGEFENWSRQVSERWSGKFALTGNDHKPYPISVELARAVPTYKDYTIEVIRDQKAREGRGLFGTESMTKWGVNDPQDIPHEVGHMLGNKDEYGTVDGHDYGVSYEHAPEELRSVMRRGDQPVRERHFELIREKVAGTGWLPGTVTLTRIMPGRAMGAAAGPPASASTKSPAKVATSGVSAPAKPAPLKASASTGGSTAPVKAAPSGVVSGPAKPAPLKASASAGGSTAPVKAPAKARAKASASSAPSTAPSQAQPLPLPMPVSHPGRVEKLTDWLMAEIRADRLSHEMETLTTATYPNWSTDPTHSLGLYQALNRL